MLRYIIVAMVVFVAGCGVPVEIRRSIDFLDTVLATAVVEHEHIPADTEDKAIRAIRRAAPHADNLRRWVTKEQADEIR